MRHSFRHVQFRSGLLIGLLALVFVGCAPKRQDTESSTLNGTVTVDAEITKGSRFNFYYNNQWTSPETQPVLAGQRKKYIFQVPANLTSFRLDPSEQSGSQADIYSINIDIPGMHSKSLPLSDLPKFIQYHCMVGFEDGKAVVRATGSDEYFMSIVAPATYPDATPSPIVTPTKQ